MLLMICGTRITRSQTGTVPKGIGDRSGHRGRLDIACLCPKPGPCRKALETECPCVQFSRRCEVPNRDRAERHWRPARVPSATSSSSRGPKPGPCRKALETFLCHFPIVEIDAVSQTGTVPKGIGDVLEFLQTFCIKTPVPNRDRAERHWRPHDRPRDPLPGHRVPNRDRAERHWRLFHSREHRKISSRVPNRDRAERHWRLFWTAG